ncbi:class I SAM-dependent methyltransferase [Streptomyces oryzae]|uniref:Class I SAM-dependent methyltransferase n=1 Tax=Streptomyces oryzae TaxID=1434886 RepID=A0ABS3XLP0_9ACTN|nr:class I SAM-dependent methyltransferase [Streptomyces oryzae]MBO8196224.1 class I SAM-dependent methyltransferase [Streptomyces oryzae]
MPTTPSGSTRPSEPEPHQLREMAESFGVDPERYDRTRPRYPDRLVRRVVEAGPGPDVLDVGCGTGIAARQFQAAGCRVLGVEPDVRLAAFARRGGLEVEVATFETWDPAGRTFDVVVSGQAWHWVDPVAGAAGAARVLRPGGLLAAFWNTVQLPPEVTEAFAAAYQQVVPDAPVDLRQVPQGAGGRRPLSDKAVDGIREAGGFGEPEEWRFSWEQSCTREEWLDQMPTQGLLTTLPAAEQAPVLEAVGAAVDAIGGSFTVGYTTVAVTARRTDAAVGPFGGGPGQHEADAARRNLSPRR